MELRRLTGLGRVTRDLSGARDLATATDIVTRHVAEIVESELAILCLREGDEMLVLGRRGTTVMEALRRDRFGIDEPSPLCDAARTGRPVVLVGREAVQGAYPHLVEGPTQHGDQSVLAFPLLGSGEEAMGSLGLRFSGSALRPEATEVEMLSILADVCSQTLLRLRAEALGADRERKLAFLSAASEELAGSLDQRATLATVARLAVEGFADWCGVAILEDNRLTTLAVEHRDPALRDLARTVLSQLRGDGSSPTVSRRVLRTGRGEVHSPLTPERIALSNPDPRFLDLIRRLGLRSVIVVPLSVRGRMTGTMTFSWSWRLVGQGDLAFATDLARHAALAIDNAELFSQTQRAAQTLQHALLPHELPRLAGWDVAALYRPSGRAEVGGDFYDLIDLGSGRFVVVIGDVMGRGVDAAAAAARLQAGVRALVAADPSPQVVAAGLDRLFDLTPDVPLVTMAALAFDCREEVVEVLVAGHLPPLVLHADGRVTAWAGTSWPAFGVGRYERTSDRMPFGTGDTMVLYTDGLVERRDEDLGVGIARLSAAVAATDPSSLERFLDSVTAGVRRVDPPHHEDDVAVVAVRRLG